MRCHRVRKEGAMERVSLSLSPAACTPFGNNLVNNFLDLVGKIPLFVLGFKLRKKNKVVSRQRGQHVYTAYFVLLSKLTFIILKGF